MGGKENAFPPRRENELRLGKGSEIAAVLFLAAALILAFALWAPPSFSGVLGRALTCFTRGLLGSGVNLLPLFFLYLAAESWLQRQDKISQGRRLCIFFLLLGLLALLALIGSDSAGGMAALGRQGSAVKALAMFWESGQASAMSFWNGGLLGGLAAFSLMQVLGKIGAYVFLVAMLLALCILVFDLSLRKIVGRTALLVGETGRKVGVLRQNLRRKNEEMSNEEDTGNGNEDVQKEEGNEMKYNPDFSDERPQRRKAGERTADDFGYPETAAETSANLDLSFPKGDWYLEPDRRQRRDPLSFPSEFERVEPKKEAAVPQIRAAYIPIKAEYLLQTEVEKPAASEKSRQPLPVDQVSDSRPEISTGDFDSELLKRAESIQEDTSSLHEVSDREKWQDRGAVSAKGKKREQISLLSRYAPPPLSLLKEEDHRDRSAEDKEEIRLLGAKLEQTLNDFGIDAKVINFITGPTISRFELRPGPGIKVSRIVNLADDIALALAATAVRIEAPIPGKSAIGIEIPNKNTRPVLLRGLIETAAFRNAKSPLTAALGRDIQGGEILCDLASMPHLLIAGATGSGKSVCINAILISLLCHTSPRDLRLAMIDPKVVELSIYNGIPHLETPVVTDPKKAYGVLDWAVNEMNRRYALFAEASVRDFRAYNELVASRQLESGEHLPYILLVIDELSDLMATTPSEVESAIARLTAMARAAGIHLIIATQRPSVDVITGVIKANIPSRVAFAVASQVDSRTILDMGGAEKLLGKGDMLYYPQSSSKPLRGQGAFVTDAEVERVIAYLKDNYSTQYNDEMGRMIELTGTQDEKGGRGSASSEQEDELLLDALTMVMEGGYASVSLLQRRLGVGHPRAARIVDTLQARGWIGPPEGSKPRKLLITKEEYENILENWGLPGEQV